FQYCFVNDLVGAAWIPWGLRAIDRVLRQGRRRGVAGLAAVLALHVLGGDPEAAYLPAAGGAGDGRDLRGRAGGRGATGPPPPSPARGGESEARSRVPCPPPTKGGCAAHARTGLVTCLSVLGAVGLWIAATLGLASARIAGPGFRVTNGLVLAA